jgi:hypothetical protein
MTKTIYDIELLLSLKEKAPNIDILIHEMTDNFFEEIEKYYPIGFNGIDWKKHKPILFELIDDTNNEGVNIKIFSFFLRLTNEHPYLQDENVVVFGDNLTSIACQMKFKDFIELFDDFCSIPQHTYIWFMASKKCIHFTFENELFFG